MTVTDRTAGTDTPLERSPGGVSLEVAAAPAGLPARRRRLGAAVWAPPLVVLAVVLGLWYLVSYVVLEPGLQFLLPPPHQVALQGFGDPGTLADMGVALGHTLQVAGLGLLLSFLLGTVWAVAMSQARWVERSLFPYAVVLQCIPILALVPLIGFWFGFGFASRVIVCVLISLFPIVSNTLFGLQAVDRGQHELFTLHHASRWTRLVKLELPASLPAVFAALRIAAGLSVIGAVVGDLFFKQGEPGIGILIDNYRARLQSPELFAAIIVASLAGVVIFLLFGWLGRRVVGAWYDTSRADA